MERKISLKAAGIILASAVIFAFVLGIVITGSLSTVANRANAQDRGMIKKQPIPLVTEEGESPFVRVASEVMPAVVNVSAERKIVQANRGFRFEGPFEDFFKDFFRELPPQVGKSQTLGSGVIIDSKGYILTNNHVIRDADKIIIRLMNKKEYKGSAVKVIGTDLRTDLALLKIEADEALPAARLGNSDEIKVGDWAIAIGNPFALDGTVTVGVISAKHRSGISLPEGPVYQNFIQTDAAINPGNSGGPLINIHGEVIGINTAITSAGMSPGNIGIGFAIPISLARKVADDLKLKGKVVRGYLGVYPQQITDELKESMRLASTDGVLLGEILPGTPADKAGLKDGDVIVEYNGRKITDAESFRLMVADTPVGTEVPLKVIREGKTMTVRARVAEMPEDLVAQPPQEVKQELGLKVANISSDDAKELGVAEKEGVVVIEVEPGSPGDEAGIKRGDVITKIDLKPVKSVAEYLRLTKSLKSGKAYAFQIKQGGRSRFVSVRKP